MCEAHTPIEKEERRKGGRETAGTQRTCHQVLAHNFRRWLRVLGRETVAENGETWKADEMGNGERGEVRENFSRSGRVVVAVGTWVLGDFLGLCWLGLGFTWR